AEEHRRLLARLAFEADVRLDDELGAGGGQAIGEGLPVLEREDDAEVRDGDVAAVDRIVRGGGGCVGCEVGDDLVAVEIEVDPLVRTAPFAAANHPAPKFAGGGKVVDGKGEVERAKGHGEAASGCRRCRFLNMDRLA